MYKQLITEKIERTKKIQKFLDMHGGDITGKEQDCIRFIEGMDKDEKINPYSLGGKISRLRSSIKNLKL